MHIILAFLLGALNSLSIVGIIIVIILLIINWKIALPVTLLLAYLLDILTRYQDTSKIGWRPHILWWTVQLMVLGGIIYGKQIITYADDLITEYSEGYDHLTYRFISNGTPYTSTFQLTDDTLTAPSSTLFDDLEVGMSPFTVVNRTRHIDKFMLFKVNGVYFNNFDRFYYNNHLYGIRFTFNNHDTFAHTDSVVQYLAQKYGPPHYEERHATTYTARWQYRNKHLLIESDIKYNEGTLYIYHPQTLAQKSEEEARKRQEEIDKIIRERQAKEEAIAREIAIMEREREEKNRRLQNGL